jgi:hypothetical protein
MLWNTYNLADSQIQYHSFLTYELCTPFYIWIYIYTCGLVIYINMMCKQYLSQLYDKGNNNIFPYAQKYYIYVKLRYFAWSIPCWHLQNLYKTCTWGQYWSNPMGHIDRKIYFHIQCMYSYVKLQIPDLSYLTCIIT